MKYNIHLISENSVRESSNLDNNIQAKFIGAAIEEAQLDLEEVLGQRLMEKLQTMVEDGSISGETIYHQLIDECHYFLVAQSVKNVLMVSNYKISNAGVVQTNDDNMTSVKIDELNTILDFYSNKSDRYKMRLQKWLLKRRNQIPELTQLEIHSIKSNLFSASSGSIWLGGIRGRKSLYGVWNRKWLGREQPNATEE